MCINCGRIGHENKTCQEPKTSFGIINIKMDLPEKYRNFLLAQFSIPQQPILKLKSRVHPDVQCIISDGIKITQELYHYSDQPSYQTVPVPILEETDPKKIKIGNYIVEINTPDEKSKMFFECVKNNIQFMMVSRKFSLAIINFLKGHYNPNDTAVILNYFRNMMQHEIDLIKNNEYDDLVYIVMNKNHSSKEDFLKLLYEGSHSIDYESAKQKFNRLRNPDKDDHGICWTLQVYTDLKPISTEPEWGFPKGKRNGKIESNVECAVREFIEETGFNENEFIVMNNIEPLTEYVVGTDNNMYRGVYYLAFNNSSDDKSLEFDYYETGEIRYFSIEEAVKVIRPYHVGKIRILLAIYNFLINYLINLMSQYG